MNVFVDSFSFGRRNRRHVDEIFIDLESIGGSFSAEAGLESTYLYIRCPRENITEARKLLDEIVEDVQISDDDIVKIIASLSKKILEVESDDRDHAKQIFYKVVMGERNTLGTQASLKMIKLDDIDQLHQTVSSQKKHFYFNGVDDYNFDRSLEGILKESEAIYAKPSRNHFTDKELEQKVVFYGYRTAGVSEFPFTITQVATSALSAGLTGIVIEEIREKRSAAYYAGYKHVTLSNRGCAFMYAGVSEHNVVECVSIMDQIFKNIKENTLSQDQLDVAINYSTGKLARAFDSIETIVFMYLHFYMYGKEIKKYKDYYNEVKNISKDDLIVYYKKVQLEEPVLVVNGKLPPSKRNKLRSIIL